MNVKIKAFMLIFILLTALTACDVSDNIQSAPGNEKTAASAESESKELVVYGPHPVDFINPIISEFEAETGISVEVVNEGTGELLQRVEDEQDNPVGDIFWGGSNSTILPKKDLFEKYISVNEDALFDYCKNVEGMITRFTVVPSVIMVNTKLIGNIKVEGYEDILNLELKGKIAFADPGKSSSSFEHLINMLYAMGKGDPEKGWDYVSKLCENLDGKLLDSSSDVYKGVAYGEYTIGLTFEEAAATYLKDGAPVQIVYMREGVVLKPDSVQIIKGAKNMDNAKKFIDFVTSKETQTLIANQLCRRSARMDVPAANGLKEIKDINVIKDNEEINTANKQIWIDKFKDIFNSVSAN